MYVHDNYYTNTNQFPTLPGKDIGARDQGSPRTIFPRNWLQRLP